MPWSICTTIAFTRRSPPNHRSVSVQEGGLEAPWRSSSPAKDQARDATNFSRLLQTTLLDFESVKTALALIFAYLIGSVDFGVIVPRLMGIDIYEHGSGNPGTSNVLRTLGKRPAALVLLGDLLNGMAAAAIGDLWLGTAVGFACGLAAVVGHVLPVWHRFRGGRGVATGIGAAVWLTPAAGLIIAVAWAVIVLTTRTASIASLAAMAAFVPLLALFGERGWSLVWAGGIVAVVVARHAPNIRRMIQGREGTVTTP
jgi:acyl phosphate:glycerol-3-phosphate acyltransferase